MKVGQCANQITNESGTTRRAGSLRKAPRGGLLRQVPHAIAPRIRQYPLASGVFLTTHCGPASPAPVVAARASRLWRFTHTETKSRPTLTEHDYPIARRDGRALSSHTAGGGGLLCELVPILLTLYDAWA